MSRTMSRESSHAELLESAPISPWVMQQMSRPNFQYSEAVPDCKSCRFTFYSTDCQLYQDGSARCFRCLGTEDPNYPVRPCCWGRNHASAPIQLNSSEFRPRVSRNYCHTCYHPSLPNARLNDGPPYRQLPRCANPSNQVIYELLVPLMWTSVSPPEREIEMKFLLINWLDFLQKVDAPHPLRCLNCKERVHMSTKTGVCHSCRAGDKPCMWNHFKPCHHCGHFERIEDFTDPWGRECVGCNRCLQVWARARHRARERAQGGAQGGRGGSHGGGVHRRRASSGAGDHARVVVRDSDRGQGRPRNISRGGA
ncbi:hypothetical protein F5B18DRAFT_609165 [Nemania serpens]|nr:hypothetical protein F5B18DRAFT_609165 [Nemania serpens]